MTNDGATRSRRGRLPAAARAEREQAILDATMVELIESGPTGLSMAKVAERAGASKETLYTWFSNRDGLLNALILSNGKATLERVETAFTDLDQSPADVLSHFARNLLELLVSPTSIALNRAAMSSPPLAEALLASGRMSVGPVVERYLAQLNDIQLLAIDDPAEAFELLYGLVVRDTQIRVLLGDERPSTTVVKRRAEQAVATFIDLHRKR